MNGIANSTTSQTVLITLITLVALCSVVFYWYWLQFIKVEIETGNSINEIVELRSFLYLVSLLTCLIDPEMFR